MFHVLPTNPEFQKLQPLQLLWILNNMNEDAELLTNTDAEDKQTFETDLDDFLAEINKLKDNKI